MTEIVNLRRARRAALRERAAAEAAENRRRHGIPKSERNLVHARSEQTQRTLDGARLPDPPLTEG